MARGGASGSVTHLTSPCGRHTTDTQQFLLEGDDATRARVFAELNCVSAQHQLAFKSAFAAGGRPDDSSAQVSHVTRAARRARDRPPQIAELHYDVQEISKELCSLSASLMSMASHPHPSSPSYWQLEIQLVEARKQSGLPVWLAHSDASVIKQLLSECALQLPRATAFVQEALAQAFSQPLPSTCSRAVLQSCRIKNAKRCARSCTHSLRNFKFPAA